MMWALFAGSKELYTDFEVARAPVFVGSSYGMIYNVMQYYIVISYHIFISYHYIIAHYMLYPFAGRRLCPTQRSVTQAVAP